MRAFACAAFVLLLAACGSAANPTATATQSPAATQTATQTATPAVSDTELIAAAQAIYPACDSSCPSGSGFTVCNFHGGTDPFAGCAITARLKAQLDQDTQGVISAPDPLGGGQDPFWATETVTAEPSGGAGTAHVVLGNGSSFNKTDLVFVMSGGKLMVDDLYCTGSDPTTTDAYAPGWLNRSSCPA